LIHCIALYLGYQTVRLLIEKKKEKTTFSQTTTRGGEASTEPEGWQTLFKPTTVPDPSRQPEHARLAPRDASRGSGLGNPGQTSLGS